MTPRAEVVTMAVHGLIALALIAAVTVLAWHKTFTGGEAIAMFGTVIGLVGGSAVSTIAGSSQAAVLRAQAETQAQVRKPTV